MKFPSSDSGVQSFLEIPNLVLIALALPFVLWPRPLVAQDQTPETCSRPAVGSVVDEPADLRSKNGVLEINLIAKTVKESDGRTRYCFTS